MKLATDAGVLSRTRRPGANHAHRAHEALPQETLATRYAHSSRAGGDRPKWSTSQCATRRHRCRSRCGKTESLEQRRVTGIIADRSPLP